MEVIEVETTDKKCVLCKRGTVDEESLGKLYSRDNVVVHYYCLLFASNMPQNGKKDSDGILGFVLNDILKEVKRVHAGKINRAFYKCKYCGEEGATIGCCVKVCKAIFHFPCGLENGIHYQFSKFDSFCRTHGSLPKAGKLHKNAACPICKHTFSKEEVGRSGKQNLVIGKCCQNACFHKLCIQKYALNAGLHTFKCPCCNSETFKDEAEYQGIYVPDQDATWELEGAFHDQLVDDSFCEAKQCRCEEGKDFDGEIGSDWQLVRCCSCGAVCTHLKCGAVQPEDAESWNCQICCKMNERAKRARVE